MPGFGEAQPDAARFFKIRGQHHVQQSSLTVCPDLRHADNRIGQPFSGLPAFELTALQGHQQAFIVRQKRQRPGVIEFVLQHLDLDRLWGSKKRKRNEQRRQGNQRGSRHNALLYRHMA
jgi:hypothetical protein